VSSLGLILQLSKIPLFLRPRNRPPTGGEQNLAILKKKRSFATEKQVVEQQINAIWIG
jgi:hypothetical protein